MNIFSQEVRNFLDLTYANELLFGSEDKLDPKIAYDVVELNIGSSYVNQVILGKYHTKLLLLSGNTLPGDTSKLILPLLKNKKVGIDFFIAYRSNVGKEKRVAVAGVTDRCSFVAANLLSFMGNRVTVLKSIAAAEIANLFINKFNSGKQFTYLHDLRSICKENDTNMWEIFDSI